MDPVRLLSRGRSLPLLFPSIACCLGLGRSAGAAPKPRRRKEGGKDRYDDDDEDEDDGLERLLRSTAAFALNFKDGPEVGSASVPRPGDFSSNFSTNQYVRARAAARRAAEDREAGEAGRHASALEEEARARRREEERAARLRTFDSGRHEAEWSRFLNRSLGKRALTLKDLPLIPPEQYGSLPEVLGREEMRRLLVRWHPDKVSEKGRREGLARDASWGFRSLPSRSLRRPSRPSLSPEQEKR